ncbi:MAG: flagellar hook protein FlgE [Alphaproteobacteria bacterium]
MTIGLFTSSVQGMNVQSHSMAQISTNIANVNTVAYKRSETNFQTILGKENLSLNSFSGVAATDRRYVEDIGQFVSSSGQYDVAINGSGFFVVNDSVDGDGQNYYTRAGNFSGLSLTNSDGTIDSYLGTESGYYVMGWMADDDGTFPTGEDLEALNIEAAEEIDGTATTSVTIRGNIAADCDDESQSIGLAIYGPDFDAKNISAVFTETDTANVWELSFVSSEGTVTSPAADEPITVRFDDEGNFAEPTTGIPFSITWADGSGSNTVELDISEMTQLGDEKIILGIDQNGQETGQLLSTSFDSNGVLSGIYSNGVSKPICKLAQAEFTVPNNLEAVSGNLFKATFEAGEITIKGDGENGAASPLLVSTLESSNVDLVDQFSKMVITQKAYSTAATAFKTTDEMLQEVANLKQ